MMTEEKSAMRYILLRDCNILSCGADLPPVGNAERFRAASDTEVINDDLEKKDRIIR